MSRIGRKPILVPPEISVQLLEGGKVAVKGPQGEEQLLLPSAVRVSYADGQLRVAVEHPELKAHRALWGLYRALLQNMLLGVRSGFEKKLELVGIGYKAILEGRQLTLEIGFSHPVILTLPDGLTGKVEKNILTVWGVNKQQVGQFAAYLRSLRKPEPYKGKGIRYVGEQVRKKAGKAAKAAGVK